MAYLPGEIPKTIIIITKVRSLISIMLANMNYTIRLLIKLETTLIEIIVICTIKCKMKYHQYKEWEHRESNSMLIKSKQWWICRMRLIWCNTRHRLRPDILAGEEVTFLELYFLSDRLLVLWRGLEDTLQIDLRVILKLMLILLGGVELY